jgi:hypothetical protein
MSWLEMLASNIRSEFVSVQTYVANEQDCKDWE